MAQYGPKVTDSGSNVVAHAVPVNVDSKDAVVGNLEAQEQRSWLKRYAFLNIEFKFSRF